MGECVAAAAQDFIIIDTKLMQYKSLHQHNTTTKTRTTSIGTAMQKNLVSHQVPPAGEAAALIALWQVCQLAPAGCFHKFN